MPEPSPRPRGLGRDRDYGLVPIDRRRGRRGGGDFGAPRRDDVRMEPYLHSPRGRALVEAGVEIAGSVAVASIGPILRVQSALSEARQRHRC